MISSTTNKQIKNVQALVKKAGLRNEQNCFIIEGIKMISEVPVHRIIKSYVSETLLPEMPEAVRNRMEEAPYEVVTEEVFKKISDTVTPQGILSVVRREEITVEALLQSIVTSGQEQEKGRGLFLLLDELSDPGNLGTIVRTAEAAGVNGIIMSRNTVDIYNPKVVRSTMGAIFRVPFTYVEQLEPAMRQLKEKGVTIYAAHLKGEGFYYEKDYNKPTAFIIGNESNGIRETVAKEADEWLKIPMAGEVESLNAACAATVLMYEAMRQRLMALS